MYPSPGRKTGPDALSYVEPSSLQVNAVILPQRPFREIGIFRIPPLDYLTTPDTSAASFFSGRQKQCLGCIINQSWICLIESAHPGAGSFFIQFCVKRYFYTWMLLWLSGLRILLSTIVGYFWFDFKWYNRLSLQMPLQSAR